MAPGLAASTQNPRRAREISTSLEARATRESAGAPACLHCGLPVTEPGGRFCCAGCAAVHALLVENDLARFYELGGGKRAPIGQAPRPARHDWIEPLERDGAIAAADAAPDGPGTLVRVALDVQGIRCAACVWLLQELGRRQRGILRLDLDPTLGRLDLVYRRDDLSLAAFVAEIERFGYRLAPASRQRTRGDRGLLIRTGVCIALAMNAMMFAFAGYTGMSAADGSLHDLFHWISFGLATVALLVGAPPFFRAALAGLRRRVLHLDVPIALGIALAYGGSAMLFLRSGSGTYLDTVTVFIALMLLGRFLQERAVRKNRDLLLQNDGAEHLRARVLQDGAVVALPLVELSPGMRLWLTPGDLVAARAELESAPAAFSLDWIDGESRPRPYQPGQVVPAGAFLAGSRPATARVVATAADSGLLRLLALPRQDRDQQLGRSRFWQLLNRGYVAIVLGLAAIGALLWAFLDPARVLDVTVALLVVTCPCALGIALPLAFELALGRLRRGGIYVRSAALLEKARHVRTVFFDKTGTLTWGRLRAVPVRAPATELVPLLATLAASSNHPVSHAVAATLGSQRIRCDLDVREVPGRGLEARVEGRTYRLGSPEFVLGQRPGSGDDDEALCLFSRDGHVEAAFALHEDVRAGCAQEIAALQQRGLRVELLSGDRHTRAQRVARELGLEAELVHGELSPEQKAERVRAAGSDRTLMVGDGLNDAAAFDAAFCAGTPAVDRPVMPSRADFFFVGAGGGAVQALLGTAALFHRVVRRNLWLAGGYNVLVVGFALAGAMTPLLCAVLMPLSSVALLAHTSLSMTRARDAELAPVGALLPGATPVPPPAAAMEVA